MLKCSFDSYFIRLLQDCLFCCSPDKRWTWRISAELFSSSLSDPSVAVRNHHQSLLMSLSFNPNLTPKNQEKLCNVLIQGKGPWPTITKVNDGPVSDYGRSACCLHRADCQMESTWSEKREGHKSPGAAWSWGRFSLWHGVFAVFVATSQPGCDKWHNSFRWPVHVNEL